MTARLLRILSLISLLGLLGACGAGPGIDPKEGLLGGTPPAKPSQIRVNGVPCPSALCPGGVYTLSSGLSEAVIDGVVETSVSGLSTSDLSGSFTDSNYSDGTFVFTTQINAGETRTILFVASNSSGQRSDPTTVTVSRPTSLAATFPISPVLGGTASDRSSAGLELRAFGFATVGAVSTVSSGGETLDLGFSNLIGRIAP